MARYLKSAKTGRVMPWTAALNDREDMLPCASSGDLMCKSDERYDVSTLSIRDKLMGARKKSELIDIGAQFDIGFDERETDGNVMRMELLDELIKRNFIQPTDEDVDRMSKRTDDDLINPDDDDDDIIAPEDDEDDVPPVTDDTKPVKAAPDPSTTGESEEAERLAAEAELRAEIEACRKKTEVLEIAKGYEYTEFPEDLVDVKMKDMKVTLIAFLVEKDVLADE